MTTEPSAGTDMVVDDYSETLDAHTGRLNGHDSNLATLVARIQGFLTTLDASVQGDNHAGVTDGSGRLPVDFTRTFPVLPTTVVACLGDPTGSYVVSVDPSYTTTGFTAVVTYPSLDPAHPADGPPAAGVAVRINWMATTSLPNPTDIHI